jgi:CheY-like chemotaxis protein
MGGSIRLQSEHHRGSTFSFTIRVGTAPKESVAPVAVAALVDGVAGTVVDVVLRTRLRVLVAEDNPINQRIIGALLGRRGQDAVLAANGRDAADAWKRGSFDAIFMDVQMPEMDGFEATAVIRAAERGTGAHIPIVAMTAHAMSGDRERCLAAGMDDYVAKPISVKEIDRILIEIAQSRRIASPSAA